MKILTQIALLLFTSVSVFSQTIGSVGSADPRSMALGNEYTVISKGVYSIGRNPANLAVKFDHKVEVATILPLPNVNVIGGTNFLSVEDFNYFFTGTPDPNADPLDGSENVTNPVIGKELSVSDKQRLLALFSTDNRVHSKVSNTILAVSVYAGKYIGGFAFSIHDQAAATSNIPKDLMDLILFGNQPGRVYDLTDTRLDAWILRSYSLSYALDIANFVPTPFKTLRGGITLKYISGIACVSLSEANTTIVTDAVDYSLKVNSSIVFHSAISPDFGVTYDFQDGTRESSISPFPEPVGSGIGFDFGVASDINDRLTVGLSITDMGSISWNSETAEYAGKTQFVLEDLSETEVVDSLFNTIMGDGEFINGYSTGLSTALHLGGSYIVGTLDKKQFSPILLVSAGYHQGFNNLPGNSTIPRFTIGVEWQLASWFNLRSGTSFGGRDDISWAFGFGIDATVLEFNFATSNLTASFGNPANKILSLSMGTRWKF